MQQKEGLQQQMALWTLLCCHSLCRSEHGPVCTALHTSVQNVVLSAELLFWNLHFDKLSQLS